MKPNLPGMTLLFMLDWCNLFSFSLLKLKIVSLMQDENGVLRIAEDVSSYSLYLHTFYCFQLTFQSSIMHYWRVLTSAIYVHMSDATNSPIAHLLWCSIKKRFCIKLILEIIYEEENLMIDEHRNRKKQEGTRESELTAL